MEVTRRILYIMVITLMLTVIGSMVRQPWLGAGAGLLAAVLIAIAGRLLRAPRAASNRANTGRSRRRTPNPDGHIAER